MRTSNESKNTLARLLATENINVIWGTYPTASFNVETRVLKLPVIKDLSKDGVDMFIGHEVGHAIWTPFFDTLPCGHAYMNVVEDIRIERFIQAKYPGLVGSFRRAYDELNEKDFFGLSKLVVENLTLADRINVRAKLGNRVNVPFAPEEQPIIDKCFAAETWEQVIEAARELEAWEKRSKTETPTDQPTEAPQCSCEDEDGEGQSAPQPDSSSAGQDEQSSETQDEQAGETKNDSKDEPAEDAPSGEAGEAESATGESSISKEVSTDENTKGERSEAVGQQGATPDEKPEDTLVTQTNFDSAFADKCIETNSRTDYVGAPRVGDLDKLITSTEKLFAKRDSEGNGSFRPQYATRFKTYMTATDKYAAMLAKEFEMRKAAYQYSRASVARRGVVNVDALHRYKFSDDIFQSVTTLADAKSHGLIMMVDFSQSMENVIHDVLHHTIALVTFCKRVNIPFEVYGFTTGWSCGMDAPGSESIDYSGVRVFELISSRLSKINYDRAIRDLWMHAADNTKGCSVEHMGGTPLFETMVIAHRVVERFNARYNVQKVNVMLLSDGEGAFPTVRRENNNYSCSSRNITINFTPSHRVEFSGPPSVMRRQITKHLRSYTGCRVIGFFLPNNISHARKVVNTALIMREKKSSSKETLESCMKAIKNDNCCSIDETEGCDRYFVMAPHSSLKIKNPDLNVTGDMTVGAIARGFKNYSNAKANNRIFAVKFAEIIS